MSRDNNGGSGFVQKGNIITVRAVEDCIRATRKYTEGITTMAKKHPVQGEDFASKLFVKFYEVYPDLPEKISWDMPAGQAMDLLFGDLPRVDVEFMYDYRYNKARVTIRGGTAAVKELHSGIPDFFETLNGVSDGRNRSFLQKILGIGG